MNQSARERMRELVNEYGVAAFQTPRVLEFQVSQKLHDLPAERDVLLAALKNGCVDEIRKGNCQLDVMAKDLVDKKKIDPDGALWALETWRELAHGVRSKSLNKGDAYLSYNKTTGMSFRPPTREQFARSGLFAGIIAGLLVGAFWGGVKAVSLGRPVTHSVMLYDQSYSHRSYGHQRYDSDYYTYGSPTYTRRTVDLKFTQESVIAWLGWIAAGSLIGAVAGGTAALYMSKGSMRFVGGYSGAIVGSIAGLMTGHRLITHSLYQGASASDVFTQLLISLGVGAIVGVILGGFRDFIINLRSDMPSPFFRALFRMSADA
jgi:hypothetical protein